VPPRAATSDAVWPGAGSHGKPEPALQQAGAVKRFRGGAAGLRLVGRTASRPPVLTPTRGSRWSKSTNRRTGSSSRALSLSYPAPAATRTPFPRKRTMASRRSASRSCHAARQWPRRHRAGSGAVGESSSVALDPLLGPPVSSANTEGRRRCRWVASLAAHVPRRTWNMTRAPRRVPARSWRS